MYLIDWKTNCFTFTSELWCRAKNQNFFKKITIFSTFKYLSGPNMILSYKFLEYHFLTRCTQPWWREWSFFSSCVCWSSFYTQLKSNGNSHKSQKLLVHSWLFEVFFTVWYWIFEVLWLFDTNVVLITAFILKTFLISQSKYGFFKLQFFSNEYQSVF